MSRHAPASFLLLAACSATPAVSPQPRGENHVAEPIAPELEEGPAADLDERFVAPLLSAAREYANWGRVDELPNLAPELCRAPMGLDYGYPSHARLSRDAESPHGRKLYYLFAGNERAARDRYLGLGRPDGSRDAVPVGFTIVKQSWTTKVVPVAAAANPSNPAPEGIAAGMDLVSSDPPTPIDFVEHEGQRLKTHMQADLYVMKKVGPPETPGTDLGWIYGTLTADGTKVTSAGRVEQCMGCHEVAPHERLFGLQTTRALAKASEVPKGLGVE
jgi:hypothetical protein